MLYNYSQQTQQRNYNGYPDEYYSYWESCQKDIGWNIFRSWGWKQSDIKDCLCGLLTAYGVPFSDKEEGLAVIKTKDCVVTFFYDDDESGLGVYAIVNFPDGGWTLADLASEKEFEDLVCGDSLDELIADHQEYVEGMEECKRLEKEMARKFFWQDLKTRLLGFFRCFG